MTKQEFLNNFVQKEKPKDTTSAMPFLMESIKEAKLTALHYSLSGRVAIRLDELIGG